MNIKFSEREVSKICSSSCLTTFVIPQAYEIKGYIERILTFPTFL